MKNFSKIQLVEIYGEKKSFNFTSCNTSRYRTTIHLSILMVVSVLEECLRCRGTVDNINHFESIRHEESRVDDLAVPCRQLHLWALRLWSSGRFSQLSAFRGIILRAGLTPCLIASGRLLFFNPSRLFLSSPRNILFSPPRHSR